MPAVPTADGWYSTEKWWNNLYISRKSCYTNYIVKYVRSCRLWRHAESGEKPGESVTVMLLRAAKPDTQGALYLFRPELETDPFVWGLRPPDDFLFGRVLMKHFHRIFAVLLCAAMVFTALPVSAGQSDWDQTAQFLHEQSKMPSAGNTYGDWAVFVLARSGILVPNSYYSAWLTMAERALDAGNGKLSGPTTGNLRLAMALLALDQDLTDVGGHDLLALAKDTDYVCRTTVMGAVFGILLLENCGGDDATEAIYLQHLLDKQLDDGGWALSGTVADPDATAMTLQALSYFREKAEVQAAIDAGLTRLSSLQLENGGFTAWGVSSSESIAQTIIALNLLGIDLNDPRFVKEKGLLEALLAYRLEDGSFRHVMNMGYDVMATEQAMLALDSMRRTADGLPGIYDLTDRKTVDRSVVGLPGKDSRISVPGKTVNIPTFPDIHGLEEAEAILALAHRGILNGMGDGNFAPEGLLTRAQFCAMAQRALGLPPYGVSAQVFSDVPFGKWYHGSVMSAYGFGAVNGMGDGTFAPEKTITRQEAAVLVSRLAEKCGMTVDYDDTAARNVLSQFGDYRTCGDWAKEGLAFCYANDILDDSVMNIQPTQAVTRAEAARMFYAMLDAALLLEN